MRQPMVFYIIMTHGQILYVTVQPAGINLGKSCWHEFYTIYFGLGNVGL